MNREQLIKAIEGDYTVIFSLDGDRNIQSVSAKQFFDRKKHFNVDKLIEIPNHKYECIINDIFVSEKSKTIFIAVREDCKCDKHYDCCDCGTGDCGCAYCWSCNACEDCLSE